MPRYFFHVRDKDGLTRDPEGAEFADLGAAWDDAMRSAKAAVANGLMSGDPLGEALSRSFEITDGSGQVVATVPFRDAAESDDFRP